MINQKEQIDLNLTGCCYSESLWATGRILGGIKIWNNYHRYSIARQVDWALWNFD